MASSSSVPSQPAHKIEYDVFLSFKGEDTGKTFVDHLYKELQRKGIRTFKDDEGLEKGQRIVKLLQIIKKSRFAIVVFSKDYASAKWCLEEIATIMECQQQYAQEFVIPIFYDVEPSVVRNQTESFGESFKRHEEENTEKAKVERWKEALKKAGKISGYHLQDHFNGFEAKCVEMVTNDIFTRVNRSIQASSTVLDNFVGLETRVGNVGKLLTQEPDDQGCQFSPEPWAGPLSPKNCRAKIQKDQSNKKVSSLGWPYWVIGLSWANSWIVELARVIFNDY